MVKNSILTRSLIVLLISFFSLQSIHAAPSSFAPIVQQEKEKVVHISISSIVDNRSSFKAPSTRNPFFNNDSKKQRKSALGSGFIYSSDGYIVTNHHVIANADKIEVTLQNGKKYKAKIIGKDKLSELALIKIDAEKLSFVKWGDSSAIQVGDWVLAIGNPFGLDFTVTSGILSGRGRSVFGSTAYGQFLQTDAAINFGNSGGPLYNMKGEVIGINTAIVVGGQNLGFAVPSNLAQNIIKQLKNYGTVKRGWLGVGIQQVDIELADSFGLPEGMIGVVVTEVGENSPAEKAGLEKGDVITEFNGKLLKKVTQLQQFVGETPPETSVFIKVFRSDKFIEKAVVVGLYPAEEVVSSNQTVDKFGLQLVQITPETRSALKLKERYGLLVYNIDQTGLAWDKGIRRDDVILEADRQKLKTSDDFSRILEAALKTLKPINLLIVRNDQSIFVALSVK